MPGRDERQVGASRPLARARKARLSLKRVDPWSVFVTSLVIALFLGVVIVVAAVVLQAALSSLGVIDSLNELFAELTSESGPDEPAPAPLLTTGRIVGGAALLAAVDVVLVTVLATLGAFLYNLCASFTGGVEVTLGERD